MKTPCRGATDDILWVRRVNSRWIVHGELAANAAAYLQHLEQHDPVRLASSCARARAMCRRGAAGEDPKPWFYCGLFSEALPAEKARFLGLHAFVQAVLATTAEEWPDSMRQTNPDTQAKIRSLRAALRQEAAKP